MRIVKASITLLAAAALSIMGGPSSALAQESALPAPTPAAAEPAAPEPPPYPLDLPELHPPTNGLFPNGPRQNPPPGNANNTTRNHRNTLGAGNHQHGRSLDRVLQKADSDPLEVRVAYRRDKTAVLARDPELGELTRRAELARTDVEKRVYLRQYYTKLFASIRRLDSTPGMKTHLDLLAQVAQQRYDPKRRVVAGEEDLLNPPVSSARGSVGR